MFINKLYSIINHSFSDGQEIGVLQKLRIALTPKEQCRAFYNGIGGSVIEQLKYGVFDKKMFCAGDAKRDTCQVTMLNHTQMSTLNRVVFLNGPPLELRKVYN